MAKSNGQFSGHILLDISATYYMFAIVPILKTLHLDSRTLNLPTSLSNFQAIPYQFTLLVPSHFTGLKTSECPKTDSNLFCFLFIFKAKMKSTNLMTLNAIDNLIGHIFVFIVWNHFQISDI